MCIVKPWKESPGKAFGSWSNIWLSNSHLHRQTLPPAGHCHGQTAATSALALMKIWTPFQEKGGTKVTVHVMFFPFVPEKVHFLKNLCIYIFNVRPLLLPVFGHAGSSLLCAGLLQLRCSSFLLRAPASRCGLQLLVAGLQLLVAGLQLLVAGSSFSLHRLLSLWSMGARCVSFKSWGSGA